MKKKLGFAVLVILKALVWSCVHTDSVSACLDTILLRDGTCLLPKQQPKKKYKISSQLKGKHGLGKKRIDSNMYNK